MIGVIVRNGSDVVGKPLYFGNDEKSLLLINDYAEKNPALKLEIHYDTDKDWVTAFEQVQEKVIVKKEQTDWQIAKSAGGLAALAFIGKYLGLE